MSEFAPELASLHMDARELAATPHDDPVWKEAAAKAHVIEGYDELMEAIMVLGKHKHRFPLGKESLN